MRSARTCAVVAAAIAALVAAGCGGGSKTVTRTTTAPSSPSASTPGTTTVPTSRQAVGSRRGCPAGAHCASTPAEAAALIRSLGYADVNAGGYNASLPLDVIVADRGGDGRVQNAFFFASGRYIGTDTSNNSAAIRVASIAGDNVSLTYGLYRASDPECCPSAGAATVRFHWNGSHLAPLDPIPPSGESAAGSRR